MSERLELTPISGLGLLQFHFSAPGALPAFSGSQLASPLLRQPARYRMSQYVISPGDQRSVQLNIHMQVIAVNYASVVGKLRPQSKRTLGHHFAL